MVDYSDRLALIARAGKRLRHGEENSPLPDGPPGTNMDAGDKPGIDQRRNIIAGSTPTTAVAQHHNPVPPSAGPVPVRLNFAELRRSHMLTPDNMRSNL